MSDISLKVDDYVLIYKNQFGVLFAETHESLEELQKRKRELKVFVSPCIIMTKENWLKYLEKKNKMMFIPENLK